MAGTGNYCRVRRRLPEDGGHQQVYSNGQVCLDIINPPESSHGYGMGGTWTPSLTFKAVLLALQQFLDEPNIRSPAYPEADRVFRTDKAGERRPRPCPRPRARERPRALRCPVVPCAPARARLCPGAAQPDPARPRSQSTRGESSCRSRAWWPRRRTSEASLGAAAGVPARAEPPRCGVDCGDDMTVDRMCTTVRWCVCGVCVCVCVCVCHGVCAAIHSAMPLDILPSLSWASVVLGLAV